MPPSNQTTRRTFVAGLVAGSAGIAGCTGLSGSAGRGGAETPSETPTRSEPDTVVYSQPQDTPTDSPTETVPSTENDIPNTSPTDTPTPTPEEYNQYGYNENHVDLRHSGLRDDVYEHPAVFVALDNITGERRYMEIHTEARDSRDFIVGSHIGKRTVGGSTWYHAAVFTGVTMDEIAYWRGYVVSDK